MSLMLMCGNSEELLHFEFLETLLEASLELLELFELSVLAAVATVDRDFHP